MINKTKLERVEVIFKMRPHLFTYKKIFIFFFLKKNAFGASYTGFIPLFEKKKKNLKS